MKIIILMTFLFLQHACKFESEQQACINEHRLDEFGDSNCGGAIILSRKANPTSLETELINTQIIGCAAHLIVVRNCERKSNLIPDKIR